MKKKIESLKKNFVYILFLKKQKKILFDHLPKCGGTSITSYLVSNYPDRKIFFTHKGNEHIKYVERFKNMSLRKRHKYDLIIGHESKILFDFVHPESIKVTLLRDPIDRIISHFYYVKRKKNHYLHQIVQDQNMGVELYATSNLSPELKNWYTAHFSGLDPIYIDKNPQAAAEIASDLALKQYDIIGFIDKIDVFLCKVKDMANLKKTFSGYVLNSTENRIGVDKIDPSVINKIKIFNNADVIFYSKMLQKRKGCDYIISN